MDAKKCDRCGRLYEFYEGSTVPTINGKFNGMAIMTVNGDRYHTSGTMDLCQECKEQLREWFLSAKHEKRDNANCDRN